MALRISPLMWPLLALASPVLVPKMLHRNRTFKENRSRADRLNRRRIDEALALDLPELEFLELTVLVDEKTASGFRGDPESRCSWGPANHHGDELVTVT